MISVNDLKTDSENDNEKAGVPSFPPPKPVINLLTEPILNPRHIDEFNLNDETSLSEYDEEEQNILYFNDLFPFNVIHPNDLKLDEDNDNNEIDIIQSLEDMALPPREQRHRFLRQEGLEYTDTDIEEFEARLARIYRREVHRVQVFDFGGLLDLMAEGLSARMLMEHHDDQGIGNSSAGDFLGITPSYTAIRDLILRLCHRLIACSIAGRSQAPEKVTATNLSYLREMDVDSVNVPNLLARYLRLFAARRKSGAHISGGQFVARLAEHFGLLTSEILGGLTVIAHDLPIIDMAKLVRLQICVNLDDTWAWMAMGPERQPDATVGAPGVAQDASIVDEGGKADPAPEDVHEIRGVLTEQREVIDAMARDLVTTGLGRMMDGAGVTYVPYAQTHVSYQRLVRQRTGEASTSAVQQDPQQPDP
ncbi:hypothetical protein Tco_1320005 [Tanacetum coccineum]